MVHPPATPAHITAMISIRCNLPDKLHFQGSFLPSEYESLCHHMKVKFAVMRPLLSAGRTGLQAAGGRAADNANLGQMFSFCGTYG